MQPSSRPKPIHGSGTPATALRQLATRRSQSVMQTVRLDETVTRYSKSIQGRAHCHRKTMRFGVFHSCVANLQQFTIRCHALAASGAFEAAGKPSRNLKLSMQLLKLEKCYKGVRYDRHTFALFGEPLCHWRSGCFFLTSRCFFPVELGTLTHTQTTSERALPK